ncbi:hypothetical protein Y032_0125g1257 [Ancylostoma ceylanicum]|uniref:Uncharacterized protein n=1 Tax=Ancylostoma ceylanicum TaxID=53326 RepID=A0A016T8R7_9BILA|nr:hypothetical protein Y032_0125g1257 [Ancylostoma ceylanicum]
MVDILAGNEEGILLQCLRNVTLEREARRHQCLRPQKEEISVQCVQMLRPLGIWTCWFEEKTGDPGMRPKSDNGGVSITEWIRRF